MTESTGHSDIENPSPPPIIHWENIQNGRGKGRWTPEMAKTCSNNLHERIETNRAYTFVVSLDIRKSTTVMLHYEDFNHYAATMAEFLCRLKDKCHELGGWFDKFTGDGALLFWTKEMEPTSKDIDQEFYRLASKVLEFCDYSQNLFINEIKHKFMVSAGCIPEKYGLSIGVDYGSCILTDLPMLGINREVMKRATDNVTVLGRAVVGAVRMCSAANADCVYWNQTAGNYLIHRPQLFEKYKISEVQAKNKDLQGDNQIAYDVSSVQLRCSDGDAT